MLCVFLPMQLWQGIKRVNVQSLENKIEGYQKVIVRGETINSGVVDLIRSKRKSSQPLWNEVRTILFWVIINFRSNKILFIHKWFNNELISISSIAVIILITCHSLDCLLIPLKWKSPGFYINNYSTNIFPYSSQENQLIFKAFWKKGKR